MTAQLVDTSRRSPDATALPRLLPPEGAARISLSEHQRRHGQVPYRGGPLLLIPTVEQAHLCGRGGASFPLAAKLTATARRRRGAVVVANAAEGEPASSKDKFLLWTAPHLVLDGLQLAAEAVGAEETHVYLHEHPRLIGALDGALRERRAAGADRLPVTVVGAPARFLAGQETAVVNVLEGGPPAPRYAPVRISERGVRGRPTLVSNVETLAHLALVARYGADWFRAVGTREQPGSMLLTLHTGGAPSIREAAIGTPLRELLALEGSGAVLVGGYHGSWLRTADARGADLANASLRPLGASVGAGVLAALPAHRCGLAETARVLRYLAAESAGQCGPCLNGLPRIAVAFDELAAGRASREVLSALQRWAGLVEHRGACAHPDGSVRLLRSALRTFADEVEHHLARRCTARNRSAFLPLPAGEGW